jgi:tryptophan-rich sensory protein
MEKNSIYRLIISLVLSFAAAVIGSIPISLGGGIAWQDSLQKPFYAPPNWLFGPAWTVLFLLMAIAFFLVWEKWPQKNAKTAVYLYLAQLLLNVLWNYIFFGARLILPGLVEILILLAVVAATVYAFYKVDKRAAWIMVPYLLWICFATALNAGIWALNR